MQSRGRCDRPHDAESCRRLWTQNSERGIRFRKQLGDYVKVVEKNMGKEPSREQLLDAGVLPNWNVKKQKNKESEGDVLWRAQWQTWRDKKPKQNEAGWQASRQQHRRPDDQTRRLDPVRAVSVFPARKDSAYGGGRDVAYMAVLDEGGAPTEGASYQSSAAGGAPRSAQSEGQEPIVVSDDGSDGDTSSDDGHLPFYLCSKCGEATVLGGGGTLPCATCRSNQVYNTGDSVALLGLRTRGVNHRTGMIVGSVQREQGIRYGVLLAGETEAIAIRPVNLRPVYTAIFAPPGHRDKPRERDGNGAANVVVFEPADVQKEGARYESSAWRTVPEERDYESVACSVVPSAGTKNKTKEETADTDGPTKQGVLALQAWPCTDQPERVCTCCEWCKGAEQPCNRWACKGKMPLCIKHGVGVKEAAAADAKKRHCTDEACFRRSGCTQGWGDRIICQESARPALTGYESNRKARKQLKRFMGGMFRHRPYAKLPPPNEDDDGHWDDEIVPFYDEATVPWDPARIYANEYNHLDWCRKSCNLECNPKNKESEREPYIHDYSCTGGCGNFCVERYHIQTARRSALASAEVSASVAESGGWGTLSHGDKVGGWGRSGEQQENYGWGTSVSGEEQNSGGGWGTLTSGDQSSSGWGTLTSGDSVPQDVPKEGAHYESAACSVVPSAGTENKIVNHIQTAGRSALASAEVSASVAESGGWGTLSHGDKVGGWGRSGEQAQSVDGWGSAGDDVSNSGDCFGTTVSRDRPREHKEQYQAVWQFNMVVLDAKASTWEGASYTNSAAGSGSSSGIRRVESSVRKRGCRQTASIR